MHLNCYDTLVGNLDDIRLLAEAAESALAQEEKGSDRSHIKQGNAMTRAALVLLCGYFEGFVREIAEEFFAILKEEKVQLDVFPAPLFCAVAKEMVGKLDPQKANTIANFKEILSDNKDVPFNEKQLAKTGGNPTVDTIEGVFNYLGIPVIIDALSIRDYDIDTTFHKESQVDQIMKNRISDVIQKRFADAVPETIDEIVKLIDTKWPSKQARRKVGYVRDIEEILKKRNRIAHGEGSEQITPLELSEFLDKITKLATGLHEMACISLKEIQAHSYNTPTDLTVN